MSRSAKETILLVLFLAVAAIAQLPYVLSGEKRVISFMTGWEKAW